MKKFIITFLFSGCIFLLNAQTVVPNGGFEKWDTTEVYTDPTGYTSSNATFFLSFYMSNVTKSSDKQHGNYAARMESALGMPGYIITSKGGLGMDLLDGGFPYTSIPDSFTGYYKSHCENGDTAMIVVLFKKSGISLPISYTIFKIYGDTNTYTRFSFPVEKPIIPISPDSCIIGFASSDLFGMGSVNTGNWLMVDNIAFKNTVGTAAPVPNNDFENWTPTVYFDPDGWYSMNFASIFFGFQPNINPVSPGHSGNYAVNIKTVAIDFGFYVDTFGLLTTGQVSGTSQVNGFPITTKPDSMGFYFKYDNSFNTLDSAIIGILFSKWNSTTHLTNNVDSYLVRLGPSSTWKHEIINFVNLSSKQFDTATIAILSSNVYDSVSYHPGIGNNLTIDDLFFYYGGVGIPAEFVVNELKLYPNPATEAINFELTTEGSHNNLYAAVYDLNGKLIKNQQINNVTGNLTKVTIDLNGISSGTYMLILSDDSKSVFTKKFNVSR